MATNGPEGQLAQYAVNMQTLVWKLWSDSDDDDDDDDDGNDDT